MVPPFSRVLAYMLCLLKNLFLLRPLMLRLTMDTLLGDHVGAPVPPPDPANMGTVARRAPTRNTGVAAPTPSTGAHPVAAAATREDGPLALEPALAPLDSLANGARDCQT